MKCPWTIVQHILSKLQMKLSHVGKVSQETSIKTENIQSNKQCVQPAFEFIHKSNWYKLNKKYINVLFRCRKQVDLQQKQEQILAGLKDSLLDLTTIYKSMESEINLNRYQSQTARTTTLKKHWKRTREGPTNLSNVSLEKHTCKQLIAPYFDIRV